MRSIIVIASLLVSISMPSPVLASKPEILKQAQKIVDQLDKLERSLPHKVLKAHIDRENSHSATVRQSLETQKALVMTAALRAIELETMEPDEIPDLRTKFLADKNCTPMP